MSTAELIATFILTVLGILAVFGVYGNWLGLQDALGIDGNTLLVAVVPLIVVTFIVYFVVRSDINKKEIKNLSMSTWTPVDIETQVQDSSQCDEWVVRRRRR